jgi:hypothetical protein
MTSLDQSCLYCELNSNQVPLINFSYQGKELWICPQHLPILIHEPQKLAGKLPGAENLSPPQGHDHN